MGGDAPRPTVVATGRALQCLLEVRRLQGRLRALTLGANLVGEVGDAAGRQLRPSNHDHRSPRPGIQPVPARGTPAIAAASMVRATRSSRSRLWTSDLPHARARVVSSIVMARR